VCETWSVPIRKGHWREFGDRVMRNIFWYEREEIRGNREHYIIGAS
jgi:hypothetical protein